jgi:hypothetical protein
MTLNKRTLKKLSESMRTSPANEQGQIIPERFGAEPFPCEWSEQGIAEQIRRIVSEHPRPATVPGFLR